MTIDIDPTKFPRNAPKCIECGKRTSLALTDVAYPDEPELHGRPLWLCECGAFSRCRPGTLMPSGRPAGPDTRAARAIAYAAYRAACDRQMEREKSRFYRAGCVVRNKIYDANGISLRHDEFGWLSLDEAAEVQAAFENLQ